MSDKNGDKSELPFENHVAAFIAHRSSNIKVPLGILYRSVFFKTPRAVKRSLPHA
jgi:hypothetical protein